MGFTINTGAADVILGTSGSINGTFSGNIAFFAISDGAHHWHVIRGPE
jgi:hypothetical protein